MTPPTPIKTAETLARETADKMDCFVDGGYSWSSVVSLIKESLLAYAKQENLRLREALEWYADNKNWDENTGAALNRYRQPNTVDGPGEVVEECDFGYRAEQALLQNQEMGGGK